ncbi:MAG TPA: hypothetical protein VFX78_00640 [Candidatus Eisenbacteria bacterium]|nr:hypothetical protein [Candidatus Eisenbacteria bacterium]
MGIVWIAILTMVVAGVGLYLGFRNPARPGAGGPPVPKVPDQGPIIYEMRSVRSDPDRVRLEWRDVPGALGYSVTLMSATDESLFVSPSLSSPAWNLPPEIRGKLAAQTVYHWRLTVDFAGGHTERSDPAAFATQ